MTSDRAALPCSGATWVFGPVGDHHGQVGAPRVGCARLAGSDPGPAHRVRQPADRDHLERVVDVVADQQVRRVRVQRVAHPLRGERQVVVDGEPQQRVVAQPERVGLPAYGAGASAGPLGARAASAAPPGPAAAPPSRRRATARVRGEDAAPACRPRPAACRRPARRRSGGAASSGGRWPATGSTTWWKGRPTTCSGRQPNSRVASEFQAATVPSGASSTTATAAPSTVIECGSRACAAGRSRSARSRSQTSQTRLDDGVYSTPHDEAIEEVMIRPRPLSASSSGARSPVGSARPGCWSSTSTRRLCASSLQVDHGGGTGMDHCVRDQLAHGERGAVRRARARPIPPAVDGQIGAPARPNSGPRRNCVARAAAEMT